MVTDLQVQHELLKTALEATDNYLFIEKQAKEQGMATNTMIHDFTSEMARAHDALQTLGVLDQHEGYMAMHVDEMLKLHGHKETTLGELPYAHIPKADVGEIEEQTAYDKINKRFQKASGQTLGQKQKYWSGEVERLGKEIEAQKAEVERRKKAAGIEEAVWDQAKERQDKPKEKLSPASKAKAKARAKAAGRPYPNMVDNIWAARMQEGKSLSFTQFVVEEEKKSSELEDQISDEEVDQIVDDLTWEDIVDLYDEIELTYEPEEGDEEEEDLEEEFLDEKLSVQARLKKRQAFARMRGKRNVARGIKLRRASSIEVLKKRAKLAARRAVYKRFLRGRDKSTLSAAEKDRIEQQVARMKYMQNAIQVKLLPKMRAIEQKRLAGYRTKGGSSAIKPSKAPKLKISKAPKLKK
jgi:hypothetical protein